MNYQITTGFEFFYMDRPIFIEYHIQLKNAVDSEALACSVRKCGEVCPYIQMKTGLSRAWDQYVLFDSDEIIEIEHKRGFSADNYDFSRRFVQVHYFDNTIYLLFFHGFTDAGGANIIIGLLLSYYFSKANKTTLPFDEDELAAIMQNEAYVDPFEYIRPVNVLPRVKNTHNAIISGTDTVICHDASIPFHDIKEYANLSEGSISGVLGLLLARALKQEKLLTGDVLTVKCPVDMRKSLGCDHTLRNCVKSIRYKYTPEMGKYSIEQQLSMFKSMLILQSSEEMLIPAFEKERDEVQQFYIDYPTIEEKKAHFVLPSRDELQLYVSFIQNPVPLEYESLVEDCKVYSHSLYGQHASLMALVHDGTIRMTMCATFENNLLNNMCRELKENNIIENYCKSQSKG